MIRCGNQWRPYGNQQTYSLSYVRWTNYQLLKDEENPQMGYTSGRNSAVVIRVAFHIDLLSTRPKLAGEACRRLRLRTIWYGNQCGEGSFSIPTQLGH